MATQEAFTLDGLALNDGTTFGVDSVSWPPPPQRADWIGAADSEAQLLLRNPLHQNRVVTLRVGVLPQANMDTALAKIALVVDKLAKASQYTDGIALTWLPATATGTLTRTFDVLSGEITDLPIDWENGWLAFAPTFTIQLTCKPYWHGTETLTSTSSSSTPFVAFEIANVTGDIPALGRLIITDTASRSRRHVEWGLEGPLTYDSSLSLLIDSDNMVTTGLSGAQATTTGAYDPNATGNNSITMTPIAGATTAMVSTGNLSHLGVFRVKARVQSGSLSNLFRLSWKAASEAPVNRNAWTSPISTADWQELDLGTITLPPNPTFTSPWSGQIEVQGAASSPGTVALDYLTLVPMADGYGKARGGTPNTDGGVIQGYDAFVGTTAGSNLNTRTAPLGGTWATSGDTGDFQFADAFVTGDGVEGLTRSTNAAETTGRAAILGSTTYTDSQIDARFWQSSGLATQQLILRWVDASNYLRLSVPAGFSGIPVTVALETVVAGTVTTLASATWNRHVLTAYRVRLIAYATGRTLGIVMTDGGVPLVTLDALSGTLGAAGALVNGKPGIRDVGSTSPPERRYTAVSVAIPSAEPVIINSGKVAQIRYDDAVRQDAAGTYYGRMPSYRGSRFMVPVGTSRVLVKARRNDVDVAVDDQVTDATQIQIGWTPRGLVVPR